MCLDSFHFKELHCTGYIFVFNKLRLIWSFINTFHVMWYVIWYECCAFVYILIFHFSKLSLNNHNKNYVWLTILLRYLLAKMSYVFVLQKYVQLCIKALQIKILSSIVIQTIIMSCTVAHEYKPHIQHTDLLRGTQTSCAEHLTSHTCCTRTGSIPLHRSDEYELAVLGGSSVGLDCSPWPSLPVFFNLISQIDQINPKTMTSQENKKNGCHQIVLRFEILYLIALCIFT
jgi:hypothetical protein